MKVISSETRTVTAVCGSIEYTLERKAVRNINLRVRRDCTVYVSAPRRVPVKEIEAFIRLKSSYIEQAKEYYKKLAAAAAVKSVFTDGSTVKLLGKDMVLKIIPSDRRKVTCDGSCIYIRTKNIDISHAEKLYRSWLSDVCEKELGNILKEVHKDFIPLGVSLPQLKIRTMKARWGSCHYNKGMIMLNRPPYRSTAALYRSRSYTRALSFRISRPFKGILPAAGQNVSRLAPGKSTAGKAGDTVKSSAYAELFLITSS